MKYRSLIFFLVSMISPLILAAEAKRPNILFVMSDDHAAHAISAYGSKINQTPHLDRLAKEGMRLDRCFATNSICAPSRATILTGKYSHLNGVPNFNRFDGSQPTVPKYLQAAGYYTGIVGKWHLESQPTGFDRWSILVGQGPYFNPQILEPAGSHVVKGYTTDIITDLAIDFLKTRPQDKPFFLMCHHKAPHRNWTPDEKHKAQFAGKQIAEPTTLLDDYATRSDAIRESRQKVLQDLNPNDTKGPPPAGLKGEELTKWKYQRYMQDYLACVQSVDDNVGRLLPKYLTHTRTLPGEAQ